MDKKNTILLTVIAIATLLVAMVGATFAYFTAQRGKGAQADITVTTSTSDSVIYSQFSNLTVVATQQNFNSTDMYSQRGTSEGTITLTSSDNESREDIADYCYTSTIKISNNDFIYKEQGEELQEAKKPELILSIYYNEQEYKQPIGDLKYTTIENAENENKKKVCDQVNGVVSGDCNDTVISGYDITEVGKNSTPDLEPVGTTKIQIPVYSADALESPSSDYTHHIKASSSNKETVTAKWKSTITFVNYDFDQQYNTDKSFVAIWDFVPVDCDTGEPFE